MKNYILFLIIAILSVSSAQSVDRFIGIDEEEVSIEVHRYKLVPESEEEFKKIAKKISKTNKERQKSKKNKEDNVDTLIVYYSTGMCCNLF